MAHFYAEIRGARGEASRTGTKPGGIRGHIRGWSSGVEVIGKHTNDGDSFEIYATNGSDGKLRKFLGNIYAKEDGTVFFNGLGETIKCQT